jgi:hypothetical protein
MLFNDKYLQRIQIMSANGISTLDTKEQRQRAKLGLAQLKRQGYTLNVDGTVASGPDATKAFYRTGNNYDINLLATQYVDDLAVRNTESLLRPGRPWLELPKPMYHIILEDEDALTLENGFDDFVTE